MSSEQFNAVNNLDASKVPLKSWMAVIGSALGAFMAILDIQITAASLRDIQGGLGASVDEGSWISTSYLIAEIVTIPLTGWLSRAFGAKNYILANASLFLLFSMLCGFARDLPTMIVCRAAQGFTGGVLIPMSFSIILTMLPQSKRPIGLAIFSVTATFAPSIGPAIGGFITDTFSWPYIFFLNLIPGLILIGMLWYAMPYSAPELSSLKEHDLPGVIAMAIGLSNIIYVLEEGQRKDWLGSEVIRMAAVIGCTFTLLFVVRELCAKHPLVNLSLFSNRNFGFGGIANTIFGAALYGSVYILPLYLSITQGYSAWQIGQVMIWSGLPQLAITPFMPWIMRRVDGRILISFGFIMFAVSCLMSSFMSADFAGEQLVFCLIARAIGQPFIMTPLSSMATSEIRPEQAGSASALFNMMRNLGGSVGTALASTLVTQREQFHSARIGEHVTQSGTALSEWLHQATMHLHAAGSSMWVAERQALNVIANRVREQSFIMAFNDTFICFAIILFLAFFAAVLMRRPQGQLSTAVAE